MTNAAQQDSIWQWAAKHIAGTYSDPAEAAHKLHLAAQHCRLIGGAAITPMIEGHEVMITVIPIDYADTYPVKQSKKEQEAGAPRRRGIGKATLMTIANAAGVEWLKLERLDDGRHPHLFVYHAEGRYKAIDGQYKPVVGDKDNDLREGSDQIAGKSEYEVAALRASGMRSAITKAKLRALREAFGVPHGVLEAEVDKPFVFAKVIFTGRSEDPANRRMFAQVIAMQQLAATAAMYGGEMPAMQLPAMEEPKAALPERTVVVTRSETVPAAPAPAQAPPPRRGPGAAPPPAQNRQPNPEPARTQGPARASGPVCKFGRQQGVPLSEISDNDLEWYTEALRKSVNDPAKERFRANNQRDLSDALDEQEARATAGEPPLARGGQGPVGDGYDNRPPDDPNAY